MIGMALYLTAMGRNEDARKIIEKAAQNRPSYQQLWGTDMGFEFILR